VLVCVKRVPDKAENQIQIKADGTDIERDDLVYSANEWGNYAVEEAIQNRDKVGGAITVVTMGDQETEEALRRQMAIGADCAGGRRRSSGGRHVGGAFRLAVCKGDGQFKVGREIEGVNQDTNLIDLPYVLRIRTGFHEPRYMVIRKVASVEIPETKVEGKKWTSH